MASVFVTSSRLPSRFLPLLSRHALPSSIRGFAKAKYVEEDFNSKHAKSKSATSTFIPLSQSRIIHAGAREVHAHTAEKMHGVVDFFQREARRAGEREGGRVSASLLDGVRVKGTYVDAEEGGEDRRIEEYATIGTRDGNTLVVTVFDEETIKAVETALYSAAWVPQKVDARTLKVVVPRPTKESRDKALAALAKKAEDARVVLRKVWSAGVKTAKAAVEEVKPSEEDEAPATVKTSKDKDKGKGKGGKKGKDKDVEKKEKNVSGGEKWEKHGVESEEFQKLLEKNIAEVDRILAEIKKASVGAK